MDDPFSPLFSESIWIYVYIILDKKEFQMIVEVKPINSFACSSPVIQCVSGIWTEP